MRTKGCARHWNESLSFELRMSRDSADFFEIGTCGGAVRDRRFMQGAEFRGMGRLLNHRTALLLSPIFHSVLTLEFCERLSLSC